MVGRGGIGRVWAARDVRAGRDVAVKTVPAARGGADLLLREAALTASIDHPRVVGVHDYGREGETGYLVMDLLDGPDLGSVLAEGPVPATEALRITADVADALDAAHRAGVVHGDVKPANVVLRDDDVVLVDFGAAAAAHDDGGPVTFGTASYMAPEQATSAPLTPATDVYALGCLLTATLTGRPPFTGDSPTEVLHHQVRAEPPRLAELAPGLPPELDTLVGTMLAKEPHRRGSAAEVRAALRRMRHHRGLGQLVPRLPACVPDARLDPEATRPFVVVLDPPLSAAA